MIVNLKAIATCALASTVSESENDDDLFYGSIASWFVLLMIGGKNKPIPNTNMASSIYRPTCNFDCLYVGIRDDLGARSKYPTYSVLARHTLQRYCHVISKNCNVLFCYK